MNNEDLESLARWIYPAETHDVAWLPPDDNEGDQTPTLYFGAKDGHWCRFEDSPAFISLVSLIDSRITALTGAF